MNNTYTGVVPKRLYGTGIAIRGGAIDNSDGGLQMIISETATPTKPAEPETGIPNGEEVNEPLKPLNPGIERQIRRIIKEFPGPTEQPGGQ